eukprot:6433634-Prymnesium_polylepis.1
MCIRDSANVANPIGTATRMSVTRVASTMPRSASDSSETSASTVSPHASNASATFTAAVTPSAAVPAAASLHPQWGRPIWASKSRRANAAHTNLSFFKRTTVHTTFSHDDSVLVCPRAYVPISPLQARLTLSGCNSFSCHRQACAASGCATSRGPRMIRSTP